MFWRKLLEIGKIAVVPGIAFTDEKDVVGEQYVRITISVNRELLERSVERFQRFINVASNYY